MAHTHHCLLYHIIFSTKNRDHWLVSDLKDPIIRYMAGTLQGLKATPILINATADHIHALCRLRTTHAVADIVQAVKCNSSGWVHDTFRRVAFAWQEGYGAFTVSASQKNRVYNYIASQEKHHRKRTFQEEYLEFLKKHEIEYDEKTIWD